MTSPSALRPPDTAETPVTVEEVPVSEVPSLRDLYDSVGLEWSWPSFDDCTSTLGDPTRHFLVIKAESEVIGIGKLTNHGNGEIEIVTFGLRSEFQGRGLGGQALATLTEFAWSLSESSGEQRRVWLHTSSRDHPHALSNYRSRGFRVFRIEERDIETNEVVSDHTVEGDARLE